MLGRMLILPVGLPRSGKTTFRKLLFHDSSVVAVNELACISPDDLRRMFYGADWITSYEPLIWRSVEQLLSSSSWSHNIYLDATNLRSRFRSRAIESCRPSPGGSLSVRYLLFETSAEECKRRASSQDMVDAIDRMSKKMELDFSADPEFVDLEEDVEIDYKVLRKGDVLDLPVPTVFTY